MKTRNAVLCFAFMCAAPVHAAHAEASLAPIYNLTFYPEPSLVAISSYCLSLTTNGSVLGYPQSGTFIDSKGLIKGSWYVSGDEVMMSGYYSFTGDSLAFIGRLLGPGNARFGGRFLQFVASENFLRNSGTFVAVKASSCPSADVQTDKVPASGAAAAD